MGKHLDMYNRKWARRIVTRLQISCLENDDHLLLHKEQKATTKNFIIQTDDVLAYAKYHYLTKLSAMHAIMF